MESREHIYIGYCYDCHDTWTYSEEDIIDGYYIICPDCGEHICILD